MKSKREACVEQHCYDSTEKLDNFDMDFIYKHKRMRLRICGIKKTYEQTVLLVRLLLVG